MRPGSATLPGSAFERIEGRYGTAGCGRLMTRRRIASSERLDRDSYNNRFQARLSE